MTNNLRNIRINRALISVYHKEGLAPIVQTLDTLGIQIVSTGGTLDYIRGLGISASSVEEETGYPSILGGRVKTLHPKIFGGILARREVAKDQEDLAKWDIRPLDLVIVDLYPFEDTVASKASHADIIEKIDIGGISLIRAAAKNYKDVLIVAGRFLYPELLSLLKEQGGFTTLSDRKYFAAQAFNMSSHYDTAIFDYFNQEIRFPVFKKSLQEVPLNLRYGENPHQHAMFFGNMAYMPKQLHGKDISYNNLLDIESAIKLIMDFQKDPTVAIIKHNNACGCATATDILTAWTLALKADPLSAYGGIIILNRELDATAAEEVNKLFFEVILAPSYDAKALEILKCKKNRIILVYDPSLPLPPQEFRSLLHGVVVQDRDSAVESASSFTQVSQKAPESTQISDLVFANKLVKHTKSNAIVLVKDQMMLASGMGQTSRVDSLKHAIEKAAEFGLSLQGAVMASDAFFPFPDCVRLAAEAGITAIIQPGGSIRDQESIDYCNKHNVAMICTGIRHFKH